MFNRRTGLLLAGLTFATWETVDIFWISAPAVAAVMAVLFLGCTIWYVRRAERQARRRLRIAVDQINRDNPSATVGHVSPLVPDSRSHVQRDPRARGIRQFRSRSPGASRLARLVTRGAQTLQALVPVR